jgi:flagellar operon protein
MALNVQQVSRVSLPGEVHSEPKQKPGEVSFDQALKQAQVKMSNHAVQRLQRRGLTVDAGRAERLAGGIDKAAARGSVTSLVLMDELALLVSVPERTVVTAMSQTAMRDGVVTQIDSAVVV